VLAVAAFAVMSAGCSDTGPKTTTAKVANAHQGRSARAARRHARHRARLVARHRRHARERRAAVTAARIEVEREEEALAEGEASECDPNYAGACLDPNAYDYDCAGGEGDGPEYTGTVTVVGEDHYELNADPESDNTGCDP
jgi:hypothetical protein